MGIIYKPNTTLGVWSVRLIGSSVLFFIVLSAFIASGQRGGDTFFDRPALAFPMLFAGISAACAFFTGITSIIRNRERAVFVYISTTIGFFVLFFFLAEILFPH